MKRKPLKILLYPFRHYKITLPFLAGILTVFAFKAGLDYTSTDEFCESCHIHPHSHTTWKQASHYDNDAGIVVHCVQCHLPPGGVSYVVEKAKLGIRDAYGTLFKDHDSFNWEAKSSLEHAKTYMYKESCLHCHQNLFPRTLSKKGEDAHLYYDQKADQLRCLNCHLNVGHYTDTPQVPLGEKKEKPEVIYTEPATVTEFVDFTETIPGTGVAFDMVAISGGSFEIGSPPSEPYREPDEGPQKQVKVSPFWMAKLEVTWDEFEAFYEQTHTEGRSDAVNLVSASDKLDAVTGPTPPYGSPDQGWGKGQRPAITMTHFAAEKYCEWLSAVTGKTYRLPTEAEWEYACRAGTQQPYFFEGSPKDYTEDRFWNKLFGADTSVINTYTIYALNSWSRTQPPQEVAANPFGLVNMLGNVREMCSDWYAPDAYQLYPKDQPVNDPTGPAKGDEHVVRGGSFKSDAKDLRIANRDHTRHDAWMMTDPQMPKSLWWYSDVNDVGFRVVCEYKKPNK
ncbi:SUMF1/EgtB/PvdO family nonheme iron enzyme [candidate division KSB1 bacterium]|nr:SUMF1/EgtB/PvdO family nonheme iron enzyme [candidate division KSB1 bacterium]